MNEELMQQIDSTVEDYCSTFVDDYQCTNWGITAREFAKYLIECFSIRVQEYAADLDSEE